MTRSRIEVVTTDAGHHLRIVASNGEIVATTEVYVNEGGAENAILVLGAVFGVDLWFGGEEWKNTSREPYTDLNVVYVDERVV